MAMKQAINFHGIDVAESYKTVSAFRFTAPDSVYVAVSAYASKLAYQNGELPLSRKPEEVELSIETDFAGKGNLNLTKIYLALHNLEQFTTATAEV